MFLPRSWPSGGAWKSSTLRLIHSYPLEARKRNCTAWESSWNSNYSWSAPPPWLTHSWSFGQDCMRVLIFVFYLPSRNTDDPRRLSRGYLSWPGLLRFRIASSISGNPSWKLRFYLSLSSKLDCYWRRDWWFQRHFYNNLYWLWILQGCLCPQKWRSVYVPYRSTLGGSR